MCYLLCDFEYSDGKFSWVVGFKEYAHPAKSSFSALATIGPALFLAFAMFGFVLQIGSLVTEKELTLRQVFFSTFLLAPCLLNTYVLNCKFIYFCLYILCILPQAMNMTGLYESAYWFSWLTWETIITIISSLFLVLFGMMFQFEFFKKNNFVVVFLVFFLFQLNMVRLLPQLHLTCY